MTVDIPLSQWDRGAGTGEGSYLDAVTKRCCIMGFVLQALGIPANDLVDKGSMSDLPAHVVREHVPEVFYEECSLDGTSLSDTYTLGSRVTQHVTRVNDDNSISDASRMPTLKALLAPYDINLHFIEDAPCE